MNILSSFSLMVKYCPSKTTDFGSNPKKNWYEKYIY